jgi:Tfp pilus assembly protein PilV
MASQDGFQLIEVMVSALLLGLISVATFTGLQAVSASDANQRYHNEAELLAAESQEALRTDPIASIEQLVAEAHLYTIKVDNTTYTITQSAHQLNGSGESSSCSVTKQSTTTAPNFRVATSVTWHSVQGGHPVTESSIVTPPTGSSLEVDVQNAPLPTEGVSGIKVAVTYTALESASTVKLEGQTSPAGCVLFTGIRATTAEVEIIEKSRYITPSGALKIEPTEVSIAPNVTTHYAVTYNEGGAINAKFTYQGKTEYNGKPVTGDTFVMTDKEMAVSPELEVGSTAFVEPYATGGEEKYTPKTSTYRSIAETPKGIKYSSGDLFPFPSASWEAYAGDCSANNPVTATGGTVKPNSGEVKPGATTTIEVPMSYVNLEVYKETETHHPASTRTSASYPIKITNLSCSAASPAPPTPNNAVSVSYVHTQSTIAGGVLEGPFQPFGKFELCLQATATRRDKFSYLNNTVAGSSFAIYPEELTYAETKAAREKEEEPAWNKIKTEESNEATLKGQEETKWNTRVSEETALKNAQTAEEAANTAKEATEASERSSWVYYETHTPKITHTERVNKEAVQTTERNARHTKEAEKAATRKTEETTLHNRKTTEEASKTARESEETHTKEAKTKQTSKQSTAISEEEKYKTEKNERVTKGTAAAVEAGTC